MKNDSSFQDTQWTSGEPYGINQLEKQMLMTLQKLLFHIYIFTNVFISNQPETIILGGYLSNLHHLHGPHQLIDYEI